MPLNHAGNVVPFLRGAPYLHQRALKNRREGNLLDALELIRRALEIEPTNADYRMDQAEILCEMGCHVESNRLIVNMLAEEDASREGFFGLCCNFYAMNDLPSAYYALSNFLARDEKELKREEVSEMCENLIMAREMNAPKSRRGARAVKLMMLGCRHMRRGDPLGSVQLFRKALRLDPMQEEARSLLALALSVMEKHKEAVEVIAPLIERKGSSIKTLCIAARIYAHSDDRMRAMSMVERARKRDLDYDEAKLVVNAACDLMMHEAVREISAKALGNMPYDAQLLHIHALSLVNLGAPQESAIANWARIRRIEPEDTVAQYHQANAEKGRLSAPLVYRYQVSDEERLKRVKRMSEAVQGGTQGLKEAWAESQSFRQTVRWALYGDEYHLSKVAINLLSLVEGEECERLLRGYLVQPDADGMLKQYASTVLYMKNAPQPYLMLAEMGLAFVNVAAVNGEIPRQLPLSVRRVLNTAVNRAKADFGDLSEPLTKLWMDFTARQGSLRPSAYYVETWAAGLLMAHLLSGEDWKHQAEQVIDLFGCHPRAMLRYARAIRRVRYE